MLRFVTSQHASAHFRTTSHPVMQSYEPGEGWFYDFRTGEGFDGPRLADPQCHPSDQPAPGPADRVPTDWRTKIN